ncbi:Sigma-54 dependent transcriptional regulator [Desulfosarcina cetonica]|uniref:sigma 54-interacting transcriptional regulator n=1 Tax=Desulfosarcina cetonica TaxID=90730 RepID=UPI0006CF5436|nr:sigma 54-interacting transcriptional regulator [Desulfosarcina cetonica]VTR65166.1 Sigma-54 dependent transcriptional regulator [Desulfosarcina cetonica]
MHPSVKLNLLFRDRIGVVADISSRLADQAMNIISMEVERKNDMADVYLEIHPGDRALSAKEVLETLSGIDGLQSIRIIQTLPNENRQNTFQTVLDNVSDGIVSIDGNGRITTINQLARTLLNCRNDDLVGHRLDTLASTDSTILACLDGTPHTRLRRHVSTEKGRFEFFSSARPIIDSAGRIIGAVEIMKEMKAIKALVEEVVQQEKITFDTFVGGTPSVKQAIAFARKIATTPAIVSIRGESGTGKELFARAIHAESMRIGPFVPVNCAAIPETLLESELFGYESGAFTGAEKNGRAGLFEQANGGTLFLDEIGELPPGPQAKILRAIQERQVRRVGGSKEIDVDTRIITATNRNLEQLVEKGAFRQDLYYRINVLPIHLPPLRARRDDIPILADHFLFQFNCKLGGALQRLSPEALEKLVNHDWPGNVRELKNVIERAAILCDGHWIDEASILFSFELTTSPASLGGNPQSPSNGNNLARQVAEVERRIIARAIGSAKSLRQAAIHLGISHTTLRNKIRKHNL